MFCANKNHAWVVLLVQQTDNISRHGGFLGKSKVGTAVVKSGSAHTETGRCRLAPHHVDYHMMPSPSSTPELVTIEGIPTSKHHPTLLVCHCRSTSPQLHSPWR